MTPRDVAVPDEGPLGARIVIIGEAPGQHEMAQRRPFVGPAGHELNRWLTDVGLRRQDLYVTNVVPYQPNSRNDIKAVPREELAHWTDALHERLATLTDPYVLVPTGNTALRALTGKVGITKHRGSIYDYTDRRGRTLKVIGTIHPAAIFRQWQWRRRCLHDWQRISADSRHRGLDLPVREHFIKPNLVDVADFVAEARSRADTLVFDIETPRKIALTPGRVLKSGRQTWLRRKGARRITCIGLAFEPHFSITIPTTEEYWDAQLPQVWALIRDALALPCAKGAQNGGFDRWWLAQPEYACGVTNYQWDTRWMSHTLDPLDAHDLAYQASVHTREPYWKDDGKEKNDEAEPDAGSIEDYWRYNGKDVAVTRELVDVHSLRLREAGRLGFYQSTYRDLFGPMHDLALRGLALDRTAVARTSTHLLAKTITLQDHLADAAGEPLYGAKGSLSTKKLTHFLYDTLKLPAQRDRDSGNLKADEVTVRRLALKHPKVLGSGDDEGIAGRILKIRRLSAQQKFVSDTVADPDGRMRSAWGFTYTLRFASSKNPRGTGANAQNWDRELLHLVVPEPGHIFLEIDLSQAEDRVVKMLTRSPRLIERARARPWENDEHTLAASLIFTIPQSEVTKPQRYIGKRSRHAGNYGLRGKTYSDALLKEGYVYSEDECDGFILVVLDQDTPEVRDWQRDVRMTVLRDKALTTTWGAVLPLENERLNDDLYRQCYAYEPQQTVSLITKLWGLVPLSEYIAERGLSARICNEKHDSLLVSLPPGEAWEVAQFLRATLERPRRYRGQEMTIWTEVKLGRSWAMAHEWKRWPGRREFEEAAHGLI